MSISINVSASTGGTLVVTPTAAGGSFDVGTVTQDEITLSVDGGIGPPGLGNLMLAEGDGIDIATVGNVATISTNLTIPANLADLADISAAAPTSGQVLTYNGSAWTAAADSTNLTGYATEAFVTSAVANLVDSSPAALDTLAELAQAIGDDANFSTTITNSLASKANLSHTHNASDISGLANVATSGSYSDLSDTPTTLPPGEHDHTSADITDFAAAASANAPIQSVNNATGSITIANGTGLTLTESGSTLTLAAALPPSNLADLADVSGTPTTNQALIYTGTEWQPGNIPASTTVNSLSGSVVIANGTGITLTESGQTLTLAAVPQAGDVDGGTYGVAAGNVLTEAGGNLAAESSDTLTVEGNSATAGDSIQLLRSSVAGATPSSLLAGELAINTEDGLLYWQRANGTIASADIDLTLATVATSGSYNDLSDLPTLGTAAATNLTDYATAAQGSLADSAVQPGDLAAVATSGNYSDLSGTPSDITPTSHASTHSTGGSDAISPADIGAAPAASPTFTGDVTIPDRIAHAGDNSAIRFPADDTVTIETAGVERVRVDSSGRVGIGATPSAWNTSFDDLVVGSGGTHHGISIHSTAQGTLAFGDTAASGVDGYRGFVAYLHATDSLILGTNGSTRATIASNGNVTFVGFVTVAGMTATGKILADDNVAANSVVYSFSGDDNCGIGRGGADTLTFVTAGQERVRVDAAGRVGIGTASPVSPLHIGGTSEDNIRLFTQGAAASVFTIGRSSSTGALVLKGSQDGYSAYDFRSTIGAAEKTVLSTNRTTGATRFIALAADPSTGNEAGDVYYNSTTNKLRVYNGTSWIDLH